MVRERVRRPLPVRGLTREWVRSRVWMEVRLGRGGAATPGRRATSNAATPTAASSGCGRSQRALHHGLPGFLVLVLVGGLLHVLDPPLQQLIIQLSVFDYGLGIALQSNHVVDTLQIDRRLKRQRLSQLRAQVGLHGLQHLLLLFDLVFDLGVLIEHGLGNARILVIRGIQEDARERVVIGLRNGIVLMIVTARARHGEAEKAASDHVDTVVPFIGAGDFHRAVVVIPGAQAEEAGCGYRLVARLFIEEVAGELGFDEGIVG